MKALVIGGTSFVGRHIVEELLKKRHQVVLFNRGKSNPHLFPQLNKILGDRRKDAEKLAGEKWDAVIDTSAYTLADLQPVLENLTTDQYIFISTISIYDDFKKGPVLIPGSRERKVQWIDARDLAEFTVLQMEKKTKGVCNVAADAVSMETFVQCLSNGEAEIFGADDRLLLEEGLQAFELPFWIPVSEDFPEGFLLVDNGKAKNAGLAMRPVEQSALDTFKWVHKEGLTQLKAGVSEEREADLLEKIRK